ncbi:stage II sporulation protein E [Anaerosinus massiliensis]|uniref:stage II sporulation protein E n=1 Tax=Massilibacillus massiliensis TaxID=1806837 RepID=UPI000DA6324F|nr:stage II sporulation protein E [Massilibacillus massiliensis]
MQKMTVMAFPKHIMDVVEKTQTQKVPSKTIWQRSKINVENLYSYRMDLFFCGLAFLLSRLTLLGDLAPFGLSFFAATAEFVKGRMLLIAASTVLGVLSTGNYTEALIYLFAIVVYLKMRTRLTKLDKKMFAVPLVMFFSILVSGFIINYINDRVLYENLVVVFNATLCMIATQLFVYGMPLLTNQIKISSAYEKPTNEAMICLIVILAFAIAGVGKIMILDYQIQNILSCMLVMMFALAGGAGLGAAVGVVIGTVIGLSSNHALTLIALYAVSGTLAGVFKHLGKFAVVLGFILGSTMIHLTFTQLPILMESITESVIAACILLFLPIKKIMQLDRSVAVTDPSYALSEGSYKLQNVADMFYELAALLGMNQSKIQEKIQQEDLTSFLTTVGVKLCENCTNRSYCWQENYYQTYQNLLSVFQHLENRKLKLKDMPKSFREHCIHVEKMVEVIQMLVEKNKINAYWQSQLVSQKQVMSEQIKAAGNILSNLSSELNKLPEQQDHKLASLLKHKALSVGCILENVKVIDKDKPRQIEFEKKACGKVGECATTILPLVASTLKERMTLFRKCGNQELNKKCKVCMRVANQFKVKTAVANIPKHGNEVCGDSVKIAPLNQGKISLLLSDGMGSGASAAKESKMTLDCLSKLLEIGFDVDIAVKTVNSLLLLQVPGEKFATMDMGIIDKYTGEVEFLKIASAPSYIKRVHEVKTIQSSTLPIGILNQIELEPVKVQVDVNDMIIMISDGIADTKDIKLRSEDKEGWLTQFIRRSSEKNEERFAEAILKEALRISGGTAKDDMTVMVAKISEASLL